MISNIEILGYRCHRFVDQALGRFQVLAGPNGSGKTACLDAIAFLGDLISDGLEGAVGNRGGDLEDLTTGRLRDRFEVAVELGMPERSGDLLPDWKNARCRYEVAVGKTQETDETAILAERVLILPEVASEKDRAVQPSLFPEAGAFPSTLASPRIRGSKTAVNKVPGGHDKFYDETRTGWDHTFKLGPGKSALANLPADESRFPVSAWLKNVLANGVRWFSPRGAAMRAPSPPGPHEGMGPEGENLPWQVARLEENATGRLSAWVSDLKAVLPEIRTVRSVERPEDRYRYLTVEFENGLALPSWTLSDGLLRLLALTLLPHAVDGEGIYLVEEPENGLQPSGVEAAFRALAAVETAQVLVTTHSPVALRSLDPAEVLCFSSDGSGRTTVTPGGESEALEAWRSRVELEALRGGGILG